jgi:hypothetical protein
MGEIILYSTYTSIELLYLCVKMFIIVAILAGFKMWWDMRSTPVEEP